MPVSSGIFSVAGTKLFVGPPTAQQASDFVLGQFTGLSYVLITWMENLGQVGDEAAEIAFSAIENPRVTKLKGVRNAGTMSLVMGIDYTNDGQSLLRVGQTTVFDYAFKLLFNDMPSGGTSGSVRYFIGKVIGTREQFDTVNNVNRLNVQLGVNSNIVAVNAF
jgi:hypothetical protein